MINTSVLFLKKWPDPRPAVKNRWSSSRSPTQPCRLKFCPKFNKSHAVPKLPGEVKEGCSYCATEEGDMHSVPHTAGLSRKPHYYKLPHFTLSKGAKKKKDSFDVWENFSHGSSQHALTTHYIPYMFYEMLLPSDGSLKTSLLLFHFFRKGQLCCGVLSGLCCSVLIHEWCWLVSPQWRGSSQHKEHSLKRLSHTTFLSLFTPHLLLLVVLLFHRPVLEITSYCCFFFIVVIIFICCFSDETFLSDVEVASCVLWRLLCTQLSAVEDESFEGLRRGHMEEVFGGPLGQWFLIFFVVNP